MQAEFEKDPNNLPDKKGTTVILEDSTYPARPYMGLSYR